MNTEEYLHTKKHKLIITLVAICESCMLVVNPKSTQPAIHRVAMEDPPPPQRIFPPFISTYVFALAPRSISIQISVTFSQLRCFLFIVFSSSAHIQKTFITFLSWVFTFYYDICIRRLISFHLLHSNHSPHFFISDSLQSPFNKCKYPSTGNERRRRRRQQRRQRYGWMNLKEHQKSCHTKITISFYIPHLNWHSVYESHRQQKWPCTERQRHTQAHFHRALYNWFHTLLCRELPLKQDEFRASRRMFRKASGPPRVSTGTESPTSRGFN